MFNNLSVDAAPDKFHKASVAQKLQLLTDFRLDVAIQVVLCLKRVGISIDLLQCEIFGVYVVYAVQNVQHPAAQVDIVRLKLFNLFVLQPPQPALLALADSGFRLSMMSGVKKNFGINVRFVTDKAGEYCITKSCGLILLVIRSIIVR